MLQTLITNELHNLSDAVGLDWCGY